MDSGGLGLVFIVAGEFYCMNDTSIMEAIMLRSEHLRRSGGPVIIVVTNMIYLSLYNYKQIINLE